MTHRIWHDEEGYARRSVPIPVDVAPARLSAFHDEVLALAEKYGFADVLCVVETNVQTDADNVTKGRSVVHHGDNERVFNMINFAFGTLLEAGLIKPGIAKKDEGGR